MKERKQKDLKSNYFSPGLKTFKRNFESIETKQSSWRFKFQRQYLNNFR